jgi:DNA-binding transcriptional regulator LsrR (DeoR family)
MDDQVSLATRAAWLSYVRRLTQGEIADRLGVSRVKAHRLISLAEELGLVSVHIAGRPAECLKLEDGLIERFGLGFCRVVPTLDEDDRPFEALGAEAAAFLARALETSEARVIGVSHGRTLAALVNRLPRIAAPDAKFVSLLGSLTRKSAANPFDVVQRLADKTGGEGYFMPVPMAADSLSDKAVMLSQKSVQAVLALAHRADFCLVGIGELGPGAHMLRTGVLTRPEYEALREAGAVGDLVGQFLDANGQRVDCEINDRALSVGLEDLRGRRVVAIAGGAIKAEAITAALLSGTVTDLIIDESAAQAMAARRGAGPAPRKEGPRKEGLRRTG